MYKDRGADIRERKQEIKRLEEQNKRMEEQIERVKKLKQMELEKERLRLEMDQMNAHNQIENISNKQKKENKPNTDLRNYAEEMMKKNEKKIQKRLDKIKIQNSSESEGVEDTDSQNLKYFLEVLGLAKYYSKFEERKIYTLAKVREVNQKGAKEMGIPIKDMVKINKKLRSMGF